ncbi:MAG: LysM peptidoglycan-binding domain-containing protein [Anaerolineae bacterium]|nr:LysM peptidoglycan-binding domain-containing protein [Anaerolineae bacterium]
MQRVMVIGVLVVFLGLIVMGIVRQQMGLVPGSTAVPTLAATFSPALLPVSQTATIPPTFTPLALADTPIPPATTLPETHIIQTGETLFSIAQRYGVTQETLAATNQISNPSLIQAGQLLTIPTPISADTAVTAQTEPSLPATYTAEPIIIEPAAPIVALSHLNGIPLSSIIVLSENVLVNVRAIFAQGQALGRNPHAYSKVGDSTIQNPHFMARFDEPGGYNLGPYAYLQPAIDYFVGSHGREGMAVRQGLHSWTVTDPLWADKSICQANETPIACEIRVQNPAILIIRLGSNDSGVPDMFDQNVRQIVELAIANGIIPVIGTKADRFEGSNINNELLRQIAADYQLPLWDFDVAAQLIPGRGLDVDAVHLTSYYAHDYGSPVMFERGHGVHSLTALMMLQTLLDEVILPDS